MWGHRSACAVPPHLRPLSWSGSKPSHSIGTQEVLAACGGSPYLDQASQTGTRRSRPRSPIHERPCPRSATPTPLAARACIALSPGRSHDRLRRGVRSSSPHPEISTIRSHFTCSARYASRGASRATTPHLTHDVDRQRLQCQSTLGFVPPLQVVPTTSCFVSSSIDDRISTS
jgi:hypothetical protein